MFVVASGSSQIVFSATSEMDGDRGRPNTTNQSLLVGLEKKAINRKDLISSLVKLIRLQQIETWKMRVLQFGRMGVQSVQRKGGSWYITIYKDGAKVKNSRPAGDIASSYRTEMMAITEALSNLEELKDANIKKVVILTDNRGVLQIVKKGHIY